MTRTPDQDHTLEDTAATTRGRHQAAAPEGVVGLAAPRGARRHRGGPSPSTKDRRWRYADAVDAARQLGARRATAT
jgi:hypothetical protein